MRQHGIIVYFSKVQLHWAPALLLRRVRFTQVTEKCCQGGAIGWFCTLKLGEVFAPYWRGA